jgi:hypothetical protein
MAGGPACAAQGATLSQFSSCLELVGIVNQHSDKDEREIASKLADRAFRFALLMEPSCFPSSSPSPPTAGSSGAVVVPRGGPRVSLPTFIRFAEIMFNVSSLDLSPSLAASASAPASASASAFASGAAGAGAGAVAQELAELKADLAYRKLMTRKPQVSAKPGPQQRRWPKATMRPMSETPSYYAIRYQEMLHEVKAGEGYELTFNPVFFTSKGRGRGAKGREAGAEAVAEAKGDAEAEAEAEAGAGTRKRRQSFRPEDRRTPKQRAEDDNLTFHPSFAGGAKDSPFESARAGATALPDEARGRG